MNKSDRLLDQDLYRLALICVICQWQKPGYGDF